MSSTTSIEWTDATWNVITGCSRVSRGCGTSGGGGCYAERLAATRLKHHPSRKGLTDRHGRWTGEVRFNQLWLRQPLSWRKPRRIFACAHSDLFHPAVPDEWIDKVFAVMLLARRHAFQVLTKRPERMRDYLLARPGPGERVENLISEWLGAPRDSPVKISRQLHWSLSFRIAASLPLGNWPLPNVWLGTSVEDQRTAGTRLPALLQTPAAIRWISAEPLLAPINLSPFFERLDWVVVGGESGPGYRPMDLDWARSLRDQCKAAEVAFFFKQWGGRTPKAGGRLLDGRTWDQMPAVAGPMTERGRCRPLAPAQGRAKQESVQEERGGS